MCARCDELQEEVRYLRDELGLRSTAGEHGAVQQAFGLSPKQAQLVLMLVRAKDGIVTRAQLDDALSGGEGDLKSLSYTRVFVRHIRQRLGENAIETVWGRGYRMPRAWAAKVLAALAQEPS